MDFRILQDFWPVWVPVVHKNDRNQYKSKLQGFPHSQKLWILRHFPLFLNTIQIE